MSTHPNVILMCILTPNDLARKTFRTIVGEKEADSGNTAEVTIKGKDYYVEVMEDEYNDDWQISAKEGDIVVFDMVTYGYGDNVEWETLEKQKQDLEVWAKEICERLSCAYKIVVAANYW